jgi:hypothetical protein
MISGKTMGSGGYPDIHAPRKVKQTNEFGVKFFEAMYDEWMGNKNARFDQWTRRVAENRKYSMGAQSVNKYKQQFSNENGDLSYMTLDWSIVPIIPKFVDILVNSAMNKDHEIKVRGIDSTSNEERQREKYRKMAGIYLRDFTKDMEALTGVSMDAYMKDVPETEDEVNLWLDLTYKQATEIAMELGIEFTFTLNDFREIFKRVCRDLVDLSKGVVRTTITSEGIKINYVDPAYFIYSYSNDPTCQNITHAGEIKYLTISELRSRVQDVLTEEDWLEMAKTHVGKYDNPTSIQRVEYFPDSGTYNYDHFKLQVIEGEFMAYENDIYERKFTRFGTCTFTNKEEGYKPPKSPKFAREVVNDTYDVWYEGIYVVGSRRVLDYRPKPNLMRKSGSITKAKCSYSIYQIAPVDGQVKSMVERMIPFADQIQLAHLKLAQHIAKARPKGAVYMVDYMENIPKGDGGDFTILEVQDIHNQTGNLYARVLDDEGNPIPFNFQELEGGVGRSLQEFIAVYNFNLERIRDVTGLNEMRDGSKPDKEALVGVQRIALEASNNATRHIDDGLRWVIKDCADSTTLMIQHVVKYRQYYKDVYDDYLSALGDVTMDIVKAMDNVPMRTFGLFVEVAPDAIEQEYLEQNIQMALAQQTIELEDASEIRRIKNVKKAEQKLRVLREKRRRDKMVEAQQNSEMNAQIQERSAVAKAQAEAQLAMAKAQAEIHVIEVKVEKEKELEKVKHGNRLVEIDKENEWKQKHIMQADKDRQSDLTKVRTH